MVIFLRTSAVLAWFLSGPGPKSYEFIGFGSIHGPKPYEFVSFGSIHGPKPYEFIGFGDLKYSWA